MNTNKPKSKKMHTALAIVRKFAPRVKRVYDATEPLMIEVTSKDCDNKAVKNHTECAMAVALKRQEHATSVIVARRTAYVIKGQTAYRYGVGESIKSEIVSFDRGAVFEPGLYKMVMPSHKLGESKGRGKPGRGDGTTEQKRFKHITDNVREVL